MQAFRNGKTPRIAIVGGGPGGLTLARILQVRGIAATVYETEAHPQRRSQGGSLDIHADSGQRALRSAGLHEEFAKRARYEDQDARIFDRNGRLWFEESAGAEADRPEIDRAQLRTLLLDSLPAGVVQWGRRLETAVLHEGGGGELRFADGSREACDLIVGADGAWSRVRPLLSPVAPVYSGVTVWELQVNDVDRRHPELAKLVPAGKIFALGEGKAIIAQRNSGSHLRIYCGLPASADQAATAGPDFTSPAGLKAGLLERFAGWAPELLDLIRCSEEEVAARPLHALHALPAGHAWENRPGATLLGDAAHLMSPFSGEGVNMAMLDAAELGEALAGKGDWREAVHRYERRMFARVAPVAAQAQAAQAIAFGEDAVARLVALMESQHAGA